MTTTLNERRLEAAVLQHVARAMPSLVHDAVRECFRGVRLTRNGITEPGPGKCREVWDTLDALPDGGRDATLQDVLQMADAHGWNRNNSRVEYYRWRAFHGYSA